MDAVLGEFLVCRLPRGWAWRAFALVINKFGRFGFHRHIFLWDLLFISIASSASFLE
jgi:hypothetical protein